MCTLRLFPSKIEHCIEWSRDYFFEYFVLIISEVKKFLKDKKNFIDSYKTSGTLEKLEIVKKYSINFLSEYN